MIGDTGTVCPSCGTVWHSLGWFWSLEHEFTEVCPDCRESSKGVIKMKDPALIGKHICMFLAFVGGIYSFWRGNYLAYICFVLLMIYYQLSVIALQEKNFYAGQEVIRASELLRKKQRSIL